MLGGHETPPMRIDELVEHWAILDEERDLIAGKRDATRPGFAILMKFYTQHGRFPRGRSELPDDVVEHVAKHGSGRTADAWPDLPDRGLGAV
jgi:hypothetical protein